MGDLSWALKNGELDKVRDSVEVQVQRLHYIRIKGWISFLSIEG